MSRLQLRKQQYPASSPTGRRQGLHSRHVVEEAASDDDEDEDVESHQASISGKFSGSPSKEADTYSSEEEEDSSGKYRNNRDTVKLYVLSVLAVLFCLSYLYERDLRFKLIHEFNDSIDHASAQLYEARQKIGNSGNTNCPVCNKCPDVADIPLAEEEKPITETDLILDSWKTRDSAIVTELQNLARDILILKYGAPPYYVEFNVAIDPEKNVEGGRLIFELAPIELVPYSVLYFLNQISNKVWDQCSFFINLGVVYLEDARGGETCNKEGFRPAADGGSFSQGTREFLAFQEYSPRYPHEELTLGISGRPGGLGVYISAQNNTKALGPKGDFEPGGPPLPADACIGKLIRGKELFIRLKRIETTMDGVASRMFQDIGLFEKTVTISYARLLSANELN